jgi:rhodanese-related sulfurtransferase
MQKDARMAAPNQITPVQLSRLIGTPDAPALVDVRLEDDFTQNPALIPASSRHVHTDLPGLLARIGGAKSVIICQHGRKLSEGVAALLRSYGCAAEVLEGGADGWAAAALPMVPFAAVPATNLWVTRHRPKVDRIACPWLIRRFVDPAARFLFVAPAEVQAVADRFNATPFDIDGVAWSHDGADCTFDTMVKRFGLSTPALDRLATVVRAADTDRHDLAPQAAGLLALSVGLSRMFRDDLQQLEAGMPLCDALYRWARDGFDEGHDWPAGRGQ